MKPIWLEQDRREAEARLKMQLNEAMRQADEDRPKFQAELKRILLLQKPANKAGPEIMQLCERYGRDTMIEIEEVVRKALNGPAAPASSRPRNERVNHLRILGLPESRILDYLANIQAKNISTRNGPRDHDEALVRAAKQLLTIPLPPPPQEQPQQPAPARPQPSTAIAPTGNSPPKGNDAASRGTNRRTNSMVPPIRSNTPLH